MKYFSSPVSPSVSLLASTWFVRGEAWPSLSTSTVLQGHFEHTGTALIDRPRACRQRSPPWPRFSATGFHCRSDWLGQIYIRDGHRNQLLDRHLDQHLILAAAPEWLPPARPVCLQTFLRPRALSKPQQAHDSGPAVIVGTHQLDRLTPCPHSEMSFQSPLPPQTFRIPRHSPIQARSIQ